MKISVLRFLMLLSQAGNFSFGGDNGGEGEPSGEGGEGGKGANSGDNGGQGNPSGDPQGGDPNGGGGVKYNYPKSLSEEYHDNPSLLKFADDKGEFDYGKLAKSYIHLQSNVGKDKILKPNENFTEDQWKETYKALGLPEDLNDYKIENNLPENVKGNDDFVNNFKKAAHEAGVLPKQAQHILDFYNNTVVSKMEENNQSTEAYLNEQKGLLEKEWGDAFDKKLSRANDATKELLSDNEVKEIQDMGLFQNATFAKLMAKIADGMMDDSFSNDIKGTMGLDPDEVEAQIKEIYNSNELQNKTHPQHKHALAKYEKLMEKRVKYKGK